jgi:hypothetical protein
LKGNGSGGFSDAVAGTDYLAATGGAGITTVGTITTGTWHGTAITDTYLAQITTANKVSVSALDVAVATAATADTLVKRTSDGSINAKDLTLSGQLIGPTTSAIAGNASSTAIDFAAGNVLYTSHDCSQATDFNLTNMKEGSAYSLIVTSANANQCDFSYAGSTGVTAIKWGTANAARAGTGQTVYTFLRAGNAIYVSWVDDMK